MQAQETPSCTVTVQLKGDRIVGYKTDGDDWRYGHLMSHAIFEAVEKTADALKAKPARKKPKVEPLQVPAATAKSGPSQEPAVKTEPKTRDRPIKAEDGLVDLVSEEEPEGEYIEDREWI